MQSLIGLGLVLTVLVIFVGSVVAMTAGYSRTPRGPQSGTLDTSDELVDAHTIESEGSDDEPGHSDAEVVADLPIKAARSDSDRFRDLQRFYQLLDRLAITSGGPRTLGVADGRLIWPERGVYFFFEPNEHRSGSGTGLRVVRVGTHGLKSGSRSTLWGRLSQHRGSSSGGNHRGSVFRLLVGLAIQSRDPHLVVQTWSKGASATREVTDGERELEKRVSAHIGQMRVVWLPVDDEPGPESLRGLIERGSIALLSGYRYPAIDPPSKDWLGRHCPKEKIRRSGLWNSNHVDEEFDPIFLDIMELFVPDGSSQASSYKPVAAPAPVPRAASARTASGNTGRIIDTLRRRPDLDDDELSRLSGVKPRQQVNIICRRLEQEGVLKRFTGASGKIVNRLVNESAVGRPAAVTALASSPVGLPSPPSLPLQKAASLDPRGSGTLIIIPCAGRKTAGSAPAKSKGSLLDDLPADLAARLQSARRRVAEAARIDETTLMPAWRRYNGTLYQSAFSGSVDVEERDWFSHLLILSGGYGVVRATDLIGTYDLAMEEGRWPRGLLQEVISAYARRHGLKRAIALVSETTGYAKILQKVDWRSAGIDEAFLLVPEASTGAMVKAPRAIGEALLPVVECGWEPSWQSSDGLRLLARRLG